MEYSENRTSRLNASVYWENILSIFSPALQWLRMSFIPGDRSGFDKVPFRYRNFPVSFNLKFPQLRHLTLHCDAHLGPSALQSLLLTSPHLSTLNINYTSKPVREVLNRSCELPALKEVLFYFTPARFSAMLVSNMSLAVIENNPQITDFVVAFPTPAILLERNLAKLCNSLKLEKLCMSWEKGTLIPDSSLEALETLARTPLKELCLETTGNYSVIRQALLPSLRGLRRLDISRFRLANHFLKDYWNNLPVCSQDIEALEDVTAFGIAFPSLEVIRLEGRSWKIVRDGDMLRAEGIEKQHDVRSNPWVSKAEFHF